MNSTDAESELETSDLETSELDTNELDTDETYEPGWVLAVRAAREKQAQDILVLDLTAVTTFTDHFVICCGTNSRPVAASPPR